MRRGEVRWHRFAPPDRRRPVLILTRDSVIASLHEVTVAPITTNIRDIPSEAVLSPDDGMPRDCAVNCDHLQTVPQARLGPLLTTLSAEKLDHVAEAVRFALALR